MSAAANIYRQGNRVDQALADFNQAIALDANDPRAFHNRGLIYQAKGQHPQAIDDFTRPSRSPPAMRSRSKDAAFPISPRRLQGGAGGLQRVGKARQGIVHGVDLPGSGA